MNIYLLEIENVICSHPDVIEAAVFGRPDPIVQEYVTAAVVKHQDSDMTEKDIIEMVAAKVDKPKQLSGAVIFVDSLPKNPQGKVQRRKLLESFK